MSRRSMAANARRGSALLQTLHQDYMRRFASGDYTGALAVIRKARKLSTAPEIARAEALCLTRMGKFTEAYAVAKPLPAKELGVNHLDLMAEICGQLGRVDELRAYGSAALRRKDEEVANEQRRPIPDGAPPPFSPEERRRNVISFSLFGERPRYCEGTILNCLAVERLLPGWTCRIYCDSSVPEAILRRVTESGGEIRLMDDATRERVHPLMWRFLVVDDPTVQRYLVRDADSLIGEREQKAVQAWLTSGRWFHLMRDWHTHTELLLAGLWGGCAGVFSDMETTIAEFIRKGDYAASHVDQYFLRRCLWPTVKQSVLSHDSLFDFFNNEPFPDGGGPPSSELHVGANMGSSLLVGELSAPDATPISWTLRDETGREVCSYRGMMSGGRWKDFVPVPYARKIKDGAWTVTAERL